MQLNPKTNAQIIVELVRLGIDTTEKLTEHLQENRDPNDPEKMKLKLAGSVIVRPSKDDLIAEVLYPSYLYAKMLGYRGDYFRWKDFILQG